MRIKALTWTLVFTSIALALMKIFMNTNITWFLVILPLIAPILILLVLFAFLCVVMIVNGGLIAIEEFIDKEEKKNETD